MAAVSRRHERACANAKQKMVKGTKTERGEREGPVLRYEVEVKKYIFRLPLLSFFFFFAAPHPNKKGIRELKVSFTKNK